MAIQGKWALNTALWLDSSGNGYNLTGYGPSPSVLTGHSGGGGALALDRASSECAYINDALCPNLSFTGSCSFSFWVYLKTLPGPGNYYSSINKEDGLSPYDQHSYGIYTTPDNKVQFRLSGNGTSFNTILNNTVLAVSTWYHIVCVYDQADGNSMKIYRNGILDCTPITGPVSIFDGASPFSLGMVRDNGIHAHDGRIDDVIVYDHALTLADVQYLYSMGDDFTGGSSSSSVSPSSSSSSNSAPSSSSSSSPVSSSPSPSSSSVSSPSSSSSSIPSSSSSSGATTGMLTGTLKDRIGNTINCAIYNVRINFYQINNTASPPLATLLCTASTGVWTINGGIVAGTKYLVTFELPATYTPLGEADIAGSQYMTAA